MIYIRDNVYNNDPYLLTVSTVSLTAFPVIQQGRAVPEGCGIVELNALCLAQVDGHQVVLEILRDGGQRHEEGLHIPEGHSHTDTVFS